MPRHPQSRLRRGLATVGLALGLLGPVGPLGTTACVTAESNGHATPRPVADPAVASAEPTKAEASVVPVARQRHVVQVEGHPITVWAKLPAPQDREPWLAMVLVHGRTWSARPDFDLQVAGESRSLMDALVAEGIATYAIDLRGYGDTPRDATGWITPDRAVADLSAVLAFVRQRHPSLPPPALLGWSLGSLSSQLTAQRHPEAVSALVLYGYPRKAGQQYEPETDPEAGTPLPPPPAEATTAEAAAEDFIIPGSISPEAIEAFVAQALRADPVRSDWRRSDQWNALDPAAVRTPTLLIHGERDPYAPIDRQAELFSQLGNPDRAWVIVAGGDHAAHLEDCGPRFVHAVVGFLRRPH